MLKQGQVCHVPTYDFTTHTRNSEEKFVTMDPKDKPVVLVEGILLFCHTDLYNEFDIKVFVVRPSYSPENIIVRRILLSDKIPF